MEPDGLDQGVLDGAWNTRARDRHGYDRSASGNKTIGVNAGAFLKVRVRRRLNGGVVPAVVNSARRREC
jgi:hypothetical protein